MKLTDQQKQVAIDWWTGQITRAGVQPLNERQLYSFRGCMLSMLNHYEDGPGSRQCLYVLNGRPSGVLAMALGYPARQVDEDGGRAEAIPWANAPDNTIMHFGGSDVRVFQFGEENFPGELLTPATP